MKLGSDAAVVLVGHGSTVNADSSAAVRQHAAELRRRGLYAEVREAFWKQEPRLAEVVGRLACRRIFIVPVMASEGYFSEVAIPRALGFEVSGGPGWRRVLESAGRTLVYCRPLGTHEGVTGVILARAEEVLRQHPFPRAPRPAEVSLFIVGHGTEQDENSRKTVDQQVERVRSLGRYASVLPAFLDQEPSLKGCYEAAAARNLVVVPFFMSDGMHVREDLPVLLGEPAERVRQRARAGLSTWRNPTERRGKLVWYARSVGTAPLFAEVIIQRITEADAWG